MASIKDFFNPQKAKIELPPGEYEGPVTIGHSCQVDGHGSTLWAKQGPALIVSAPDVTLKNIRIELTENAENSVAVRLQYNKIRLENVEIYGQLQQPDGSIPSWDVPRLMVFGTFAAKQPNEYCCRMKTASACKLESQVHGVTISPTELQPGETTVVFRIAPLMDTTIIYGSVLLHAPEGIIKRIYLSGRAATGAREHHETTLPASPKVPNAKTSSRPLPSAPPRNRAALANPSRPSPPPPAAAPRNWPGQTAIKGQRLSLPTAKNFFVTLESDGSKLQVDPYAFQLYENGKTRRDNDLVFFGNPQSPAQGVFLDKRGNMEGIGIAPTSIPAAVQRIVIAFAVYAEGTQPTGDFSRLKNPRVCLYADGKPSHELLLTLGFEKALNALEIYRYKDGWKINFVGAGFTAGLRKLCEAYGLEVV